MVSRRTFMATPQLFIKAFASQSLSWFTTMAAEPEHEHVPDGLALTGLAEAWEADAKVRQRARQTGSLLQWGNPGSVGGVSMILI